MGLEVARDSGSAPPQRRTLRHPPHSRGPPADFAAGSYSGKADFETEMLVLGAGPGGYSPPSAPPISA